MARAKGKSRKARLAVSRSKAARVVDATPERLAKSDHSEFINPAEIDSSEQTIARVRRFRDSWIDRLYRRGMLTYAQWYACGWYRDLHATAFSAQRLVADYGQTSGGVPRGNYGQAFTEAQQRRRVTFRQARALIRPNMLTLVEAVVLSDEMPPLGGGAQRKRFGQRLADAVQPLAEHIAAPGWQLAAKEPGVIGLVVDRPRPMA